jgi:hypothetical protein
MEGEDFTTEDLESRTKMGRRSSYGHRSNVGRNSEELPLLADLTINVCIVASKATRYELIGVCYASEANNSAIVYLRSVFADGAADVRIIIGTQRWHLSRRYPYLALNYALQYFRLGLVHNSLSIDTQEVSAWSNSTVVLGWLAAPPYKWETFVANKIAEVQDVFPRNRWDYVNSEDNPADCASRGISYHCLANHILWWVGPKRLRNGNPPLVKDLDSNSE